MNNTEGQHSHIKLTSRTINATVHSVHFTDLVITAIHAEYTLSVLIKTKCNAYFKNNTAAYITSEFSIEGVGAKRPYNCSYLVFAPNPSINSSLLIH